jgi:ankyrin repeat protein
MSDDAKMILDRILNGRTDLVFEYLERGYPLAVKDSEGASLLQRCAYHGDVSAIRFLLGHGEKVQSLGDNLGLGAAAFHGHWRLCEFLLEKGADPNAAEPGTAETPLHAATSKANRPTYDLVIRVLLAHGADPNRSTKPSVETGCFMRDSRTKGEFPLHRAAAFSSEEAIRLLLKAGARLDVADMNGDSPLSWASWHLRPDAILRLLCFNGHSVQPGRNGTYDHGRGWGVMETSILGTPLI